MFEQVQGVPRVLIRLARQVSSTWPCHGWDQPRESLESWSLACQVSFVWPCHGWDLPCWLLAATHFSILAWRTMDCIILGVTKSRTWLSNFYSFTAYANMRLWNYDDSDMQYLLSNNTCEYYNYFIDNVQLGCYMIWTYYFSYFKCVTPIIIKQSKVKITHIIRKVVLINEIKLSSILSLIATKDHYYILLQMVGLPNTAPINVLTQPEIDV